jgi:hypothetical protein
VEEYRMAIFVNDFRAKRKGITKAQVKNVVSPIISARIYGSENPAALLRHQELFNVE